MRAQETHLRVLLEGSKQYRIPLFQRPYSWQAEQWKTLWDDIIEIYEQSLEQELQHGHFLGPVVSKALTGTPEGIAPYMVIDGQQRLTTLSILLAALRDALQGAGTNLPDKIQDQCLTNRYVSGNDHFKILPTQADRQAFFDVVAADGAKTDADTLVGTAYGFFRKALSQGDVEDRPLDLARLERVILDGLELVSITLSTDDSEYQIFESLNAKGTPLTQADLLRNYFFMRLPDERQQELYDTFWLPMQQRLGQRHLESFFRHQYMTGGEFVREGDIYQAWRRRLDLVPDTALASELETLARFSSFYERLLNPEVEPDSNISERLKRLNRWGGQTMYPFMLWLYERDELDVIGAVEFERVLGVVESFLVRRLFAGVPTNQLNRLFARLAHQLPPGDVLSATRAALSEPSRRWPDDEAFREAIHSYPLYTDSRSEQRRVILEAFELSFEHKEQAILEGLTVEHVMPQDLTVEWREAIGDGAEGVHARLLHTLGNLTLTGYNPELSNRPFDEKRVLFENSHLAMNAEIAAEASWGKEEIRGRADRLAARAILLWPGPDSRPGNPAGEDEATAIPSSSGSDVRVWSSAEVDALIADYFGMLALEVDGISYSKADRRRTLIHELDDRSEGSIRRKYCNVSAVLADRGLRYVDGFSPLRHGQRLLKDAVERYLKENPSLRERLSST